MPTMSVGAGLAVLGFWLFIALVAVAGVWAENRKREARHQTLRRMIEHDKHLDKALMDKLLALSGGDGHLDRDLTVGGVVVLFAALGLAILGLFIGEAHGEWRLPILGIGAFVGCVGIGLLAASRLVRR